MELETLRGIGRAVRPVWHLMLGFMVGLALVATVAFGATYNFTFNNTEQGDHSTAQPQINISTGTAPSPVAAASATPVAEASPGAVVAAASPAPGTPEYAVAQVKELAGAAGELAAGAVERAKKSLEPSASVAEEKAPEWTPPPWSPWRFTANGGGVVMKGEDVRNYSNGAERRTDWTGYPQGGVGIAYFLTRGVGLSFWGGAHLFVRGNGRGYLGAELELVPIRVISFWKIRDLLEVGLLAGASSLRRAQGNIATLHAGARVTLNVWHNFGLTGSLRGNLGYGMGEVGLAFRL